MIKGRETDILPYYINIIFDIFIEQVQVLDLFQFESFLKFIQMFKNFYFNIFIQ